MKASIRAALAAAICAIAGAVLTPPAVAGRISLNDTGMTQCASEANIWSTECAKSRQDAAYGRDLSDAAPEDGIAGFSYRKVCRSGQWAGEGSCPPDPALGNGPDDWGCVYDNVSQLTWEAKTADSGVHDGNRQYTYKRINAPDDPTDVDWLVASTNGEALCGAVNWRLPDVIELQSIVNYGMGIPGMSGPFVDQAFFPNAFSGLAWAKDTYFWDSARAYQVDFRNGSVDIFKRSIPHAARLVHEAAQTALAKVRFIPSPDGMEAKDTWTGLVWSRCPVGMVWESKFEVCGGNATFFQWEDALRYAKAHREGGWRIPNVKEMLSIIDTRKEPAIDFDMFPNTPLDFPFLTSTPMESPEGILSLQVVQMRSGYVTQVWVGSGKNRPLRLVRGGRMP
jgi:hypothetical protein